MTGDRSGCEGEARGFPVPRQQLGDAACGMIGQPCEHVGKPRLRINITKLDGVDGPRFRLHSAERSGDRSEEKPSMNDVKAVGLDLAKRVVVE
jgi:hypothetical protein